MAYQMVLYFMAYLLLTSVIYALCPKEKRYIVLLLTSFLAYGLYNKVASVFLLITIITSYFAALLIEKQGSDIKLSDLEKEERRKIKAKIKSKKRLIVSAYCFINLGILLILKYFNFFAASGVSILGDLGLQITSPIIKVILPIGISYYTLQALSYIIDVYRGKYKADKNLLHIALFIGFFPQLYEGPFGRYDELMPQLTAGTDITTKSLYSGLMRFIWGGFKVFMVANRAAIIVDNVFNNYQNYSNYVIVLAVVAFTIQLYAEFSGYIDMAQGICEVFEIKLTQNFNVPFISQNVSEFWRRWHMSLGSWFRDYIFYPVSTSKLITKCFKKIKNKKLASTVTISISLLAVWYLTGLWHGASWKYVVYGLYYYVLMLLFNFLSPLTKKLLKRLNISEENKAVIALRITKTLILVCIGMFIFRANNLTVFSQMFVSVFEPVKSILDIYSIMGYKDLTILILCFLIILVSGILKVKGTDKKYIDRYNNLSSYSKYWICFASLCTVIVFGAYGLGYVPANPIYGGF